MVGYAYFIHLRYNTVQEIRLTFTSDRERRTADDTLRDQLSYIAKRALAGNRGRGWDFEVGPISALDRYISQTQSYYYTMSSYLRFYRRVDVDQNRLSRQISDITEWAGAAGHNAKFGKRPWVMESPNGVPPASQSQEQEEEELDSGIREVESVSLKEVGIIKRGKFFDHLYGLDPQIRIILSSIQAAIDSSMENRFHSLLHGNAGCGKTEILQSLARLLSKEGVPFILLDATSTTEAGMRKNLLDEDAILPDVILIEEIEKAPENSLRWLLGIMDDRATIQQANYRKTASRKVPALVLATANDYALLSKMMYGALLSRFSNEIYCPRPDRAILAKILEREVGKVSSGDMKWIEPTLKFAFDEHGITDPRMLKRICLSGKDELVNGKYQEDLKKTMRLEQVSPTVSDVSDL